jgi:hypothetical protein
MKVTFLLTLGFGMGSFSPQRTAMRDKLFFGIEEAPEIGGRVQVTPALPPMAIPPASALLGVNSTATNNRDLNDFGPLGPPPEVLAKRREEAEAAADAAAASSVSRLSFLVFGASGPSSKFSVQNVFSVLSIVWLVGVLAGGFYFLREALAGGSKKYRVGALQQTMPPPNKFENMRIDREAYIYVADG